MKCTRKYVIDKKIKIICIISLCIILFVYLTICVNSYINGSKIGMLSFRFYIMSSSSAESDAKSGDLVIAKNIDIEKIKQNDDIIYKRSNDMIVKKVQKIAKNSEGTNFYIEEDDVISNEKIANAQIVGKVIFRIKGFGNFALFIQTPIGTCSIFVLAICVFFIFTKLIKQIQKNKLVNVKYSDSDKGKRVKEENTFIEDNKEWKEQEEK